jgi:DNA-directed RNA polymerase alpha subunit
MITTIKSSKVPLEIAEWTTQELLDYIKGPEGKKAREALAEGVARDDTVADLELLGLSLRTINLLEESHLAICTIKELVSKTPEELLSIKSFARTALQEVMFCLARYDRLKPVTQQIDQYHQRIMARVKGEKVKV